MVLLISRKAWHPPSVRLSHITNQFGLTLLLPPKLVGLPGFRFLFFFVLGNEKRSIRV